MNIAGVIRHYLQDCDVCDTHNTSFIYGFYHIHSKSKIPNSVLLIQIYYSVQLICEHGGRD